MCVGNGSMEEAVIGLRDGGALLFCLPFTFAKMPRYYVCMATLVCKLRTS